MTLDVRELIRRLRAGQSQRAIARDLGIARKTVAKYQLLARQEGLMEGPLPSPAGLEKLLEDTVPPSNLPRQPYKAARFKPVIEELRRQKVEIKAIFQRLQEDHGFEGSYSAVHRFVRQLEPAPKAGFVRLETGPGQEAQVDFGSAGKMVDPATGEIRKAWVFVMTLCYSRHQYATFVFDQKVATWLRCHTEAFEYFGGVVGKVVVDNLKAAVVKAVLYDPVAQRSYRQLAEHYGFLISPCRPATPRHKGKVESGVFYVKRNFLAGRPIMTLSEANSQLLRWCEQTAGQRIHGTIKKRPLPLFLENEKAELQPLPPVRYDLGVWKKVKLHPDCHVTVDGAYYSAPHRLIGCTLWARTNGRDVHLFHDYERVATHRWGRPGTRHTHQDHYPPDKVAYLMATPRYCRQQARQIGPAAATFIERLLSERPLDRLRTAQAVLRLEQKYGSRRLEKACCRALHFDEVTWHAVKRILENGLETEPLPQAPPPTAQRSFTFARPGSEIFFPEGGDHGH
jgi:transposase